MNAPLPIEELLPDLEAAVAPPGATVLLQAPPGAGKTTRVPLAMRRCLAAAAAAASDRLWLLQPRRLAARAAAERLATELGEPVGATVGYSVRLESCTSASTRLEVLTTGLFLRRLQTDPGLEGVAGVILDEFHERAAELDLALALLRQARDLLRPDLRLVVMSATLNLEPLQEQLPQARVLRCQGRSHPVRVEHQLPRAEETLERQVLRALEQHWLPLRAERETVLVFLPGLAEIRRCQTLIEACDWADGIDCVALHGNLPLAEQSRAIRPASRPQGKVVLATSIAESSLTIEGVTLVIDSGLSRSNRFDPRSGMDGLITRPSSLASSEQRAGRAGRLAPGRCLRLWAPAERNRRAPFDPPELLEADPVPIALHLARWGDPLGQELSWLDPPPQAALAEARQVLSQLGAISPDGALTVHGRQLGELGLHPRLGHMLLMGAQQGQGQLACDLAVLLSERDPLGATGAGSDLLRRLDWLRQQPRGRVMRRLARQWLEQLRRTSTEPSGASQASGAPPERAASREAAAAALLVAAAYPERLGLSRPGQPGRFHLRSGRGAVLAADDPLLGSEALAIARVDGAGQDARVLLALPLNRATLVAEAERNGGWQHQARWDGAAGRVRCEQTLRLDALVLERRPWAGADAGVVLAALLHGIRERGLEALPWTPSTRQLQARLSLLHRWRGNPWSDRSDAALLLGLASWLGPQLHGLQSLAELREIDLVEALWGDLPWSLRGELERLLPTKLALPSGRWAVIDYSTGEPVLAAKLQDLLGLDATPRVLEWQLPVTVHLLTPAGRPAAITQDLGGFWRGAYQQVRRELRGRYPKHAWPEDPLKR